MGFSAISKVSRQSKTSFQLYDPRRSRCTELIPPLTEKVESHRLLQDRVVLISPASVISAQTVLKTGIKMSFPSGIVQLRVAEPPGKPSEEPAIPAKYQ